MITSFQTSNIKHQTSDKLQASKIKFWYLLFGTYLNFEFCGLNFGDRRELL